MKNEKPKNWKKLKTELEMQIEIEKQKNKKTKTKKQKMKNEIFFFVKKCGGQQWASTQWLNATVGLNKNFV